MKKKTRVILFRIIGIVIVLGFISLIIFWKFNRLRGNIFVTIGGEEYLAEQVHCRYEDGGFEEVTYRKMPLDSKVAFENSGSRYGMYEYTFLISNEEINIEPKIRVFKTNWYKMYVTDIEIDIYEDNGVWNADVSAGIDNRTYQETFYDIENNAIEMRVE